MADPTGILLVALGLPGAVWPYEFARLEERIDSIGSKRSWHDVEPADWKGSLTRAVGIGMVLVGALMALAG